MLAMGRAKISRKTRNNTPIRHKKLPGFDAFNLSSESSGKPKQIMKRGKKKTRLVECVDLIPPETGIHSLAWASSIASQKACPFLTLALELRLKIYELVIHDLSIPTISPLKKAHKFYSPTWPSATEDTTALYHVCRQIYVDVYGSGLLYRLTPFSFVSPNVMLNYLCVINPVHKEAITTLTLNVLLRRGRKSIPSKPIDFLKECTSLRDFSLIVEIDISLCERLVVPYLQRKFARRVGDDVLEGIRSGRALRELRLRAFRLSIMVTEPICLVEDGWRQSRTTCVDLLDGQLDGWKRIEDELKSLIVVEK